MVAAERRGDLLREASLRSRISENEKGPPHIRISFIGPILMRPTQRERKDELLFKNNLNWSLMVI